MESVVGLEGLVILIVGNKLDLETQRTVPKSTSLKYAKSINAAYFETSALTKTGKWRSKIIE